MPFGGGKPFGFDQFHAVAGNIVLRRRPDHQHMAAVLHHGARRQDRVAHPRDACDRTGGQRRAVHHTGVELMGACVGVDSALAGIEQRAFFEQTHRLGHGVQRAGASGQQRGSRAQHILQGATILRFERRAHGLAQDGAGTAVDRNNRGDAHDVAGSGVLGRTKKAQQVQKAQARGKVTPRWPWYLPPRSL